MHHGAHESRAGRTFAHGGRDAVLKLAAVHDETHVMDSRPFERWCLDRRSSGLRALTSEERAGLERLRRRVAWMLALPWAGFVAYWAVLIGTFPDPLGPTPDWIRGVHMFFVMLGLLLLLPVAILMTRDLGADRRDLARDLEADRVERFEPVATGSPADVEGIVEVRQPSGRLLIGPRLEVGDPAPIREVAPGPIIGMRVRQPADGLPDGARLERRHLSPEERAELARAVERCERLPKFELVGALWCVVCVWAWMSSSGPRPFTAYLMMAQALFAGGWFVWTVVRNLSLARRMRADVESGFALVFVPPDPQASEEEGLPHSGLPWRVAGLPAEWRGGDLLRSR